LDDQIRLVFLDVKRPNTKMSNWKLEGVFFRINVYQTNG